MQSYANIEGVTLYENCAPSTTRRWHTGEGGAKKSKIRADGTVVARVPGRGRHYPSLSWLRPTTVIRISFSAGFLSLHSLPPLIDEVVTALDYRRWRTSTDSFRDRSYLGCTRRFAPSNLFAWLLPRLGDVNQSLRDEFRNQNRRNVPCKNFNRFRYQDCVALMSNLFRTSIRVGMSMREKI